MLLTLTLTLARDTSGGVLEPGVKTASASSNKELEI